MTLDGLRAVRGFIVDLDGTTYLGNRPIAGADVFLDVLQRRGYAYVFVTNNSSNASADYAAKLRRMGLQVDDGAVLTSGEATAMHLVRVGYRRVYVLGTPALEKDMTRAGMAVSPNHPDCVVLGFDRTLTYRKLETATKLIRAGVPFVATHPDVVCPTEDGYIPDCGAMIALLQAATGASPVIIGKPEPLLVEMALTKLALSAPHVAVIGDRLYTDIAMGRRAGAVTVLVLSGETTRRMVEASPHAADFVVEDVGHLAALLDCAPMPASVVDVAAGGHL